MRRASAGRSGRRWRTIKRELHAAAKAADAPCWICGQPIDYEAAPQTPEAFEPDHHYPVSTHPHLAEDPGNLRPSHSRCNRERGIRVADTGTWAPSDF